MKKREPEDEQLCIAVHTINAVYLPLDKPINIYISMRFNAYRCILPYITWGLIQDPKTKGISKTELDFKTNEIKESLESQNYCETLI